MGTRGDRIGLSDDSESIAAQIARHRKSSGQWEDSAPRRQSGHHGAVAPRSSLEIGQNAAEIVAPEWNVIGPDVAGIGDSLMAALGGAVKNPADVMTASMKLSSDLARIPPTVLNSWIRKKKGDDKGTSDRRFADPAWTDNPYFHAIRLAYLAQCEFARAILGSSGIDAKQAAKASLGLDLLLDAMSPTNFPVSNPAAMKRAFDTGGMSLLRGARNFVLDVVQNKDVRDRWTPARSPSGRTSRPRPPR